MSAFIWAFRVLLRQARLRFRCQGRRIRQAIQVHQEPRALGHFRFHGQTPRGFGHQPGHLEVTGKQMTPGRAYEVCVLPLARCRAAVRHVGR
jgi:hypothetical protein